MRMQEDQLVARAGDPQPSAAVVPPLSSDSFNPTPPEPWTFLLLFLLHPQTTQLAQEHEETEGRRARCKRDKRGTKKKKEREEDVQGCCGEEMWMH